MSPTFAAGPLRITVPSSYAARRPGSGRGLPAPADVATAASTGLLVGALRPDGMQLVESLDLSPRSGPGPGPGRGEDLFATGPSAAGETLTLDLEVGADEDAVVLLERGGVYTWHLPTGPRRSRRGLGGEPRSRHFEIVVHGAARALVFRFVAPVVATRAIGQLEAHVRPGLVHLTGTDVTRWRRVDSLEELGLRGDRPARLLLLVHGLFSSTVGAFGALAAGADGQRFLRSAIGTYDAVLGFDHKTLSVDPRQNAQSLLRRLQRHHPLAEVVLDVVAHGRGGLVTRSFVEQVLPESDWPGRVDNIVFVASADAGTPLADPKRWRDLADVHTNLTAASTRAPGSSAAPVAAVVGGALTGLGALVRYLAAHTTEGAAVDATEGPTGGAAEDATVPGLEAMVPGGRFLTDLNRHRPGDPVSRGRCFVVGSDFHVSLAEDHHDPPEFPRELAVSLAEGFLDRLFGAANDLLVETTSMSATDLPKGGLVAGTCALGRNDVVHHHNYFAQQRVIEAIAGWLRVGSGGPDPRPPSPRPPSPRPPSHR